MKSYSAETQTVIKHVCMQHNDGKFHQNSILPDL